MTQPNADLIEKMFNRNTTLGELTDEARRFNAAYIKAVVGYGDSVGAVIVLRGSDVDSYLAAFEAEAKRLDDELEEGQEDYD
jgi:hypothetical protein